MTHEEILRELDSLPPEGRRQVADFIALLRERYARGEPSGRPDSDLAKDGFIGMWRDRADIQDADAWVRDLRERDWMKQGG